MITTRSDKEKEIAELSESIGNAQITVCVNYMGLTVAQVTQFRKALRAAGAEARVSRNTLMDIATTQALKDSDAQDVAKLKALFSGPSMIIFGNKEAVATAKIIADCLKTNEGRFAIKGGWFAGKYVDASGVDAVSKLPSREETLAKLLALLNTPAQQLLRLLNAPAQQLVQALNAFQQKLS